MAAETMLANIIYASTLNQSTAIVASCDGTQLAEAMSDSNWFHLGLIELLKESPLVWFCLLFLGRCVGELVKMLLALTVYLSSCVQNYGGVILH